jgi:hypothetical protein
MQANDFIQWLTEKSKDDFQYSIYLNTIEILKINNNSYLISIRQFLADKPEIIIGYIEENGLVDTPNLIYYLANVYFLDGLYFATNYLLNYTTDHSKLKTLNKNIAFFVSHNFKLKMFELLSSFYNYSNIKNIMIKENKLDFNIAIKNHILVNPDFYKIIKFNKILNF